MIDNITQDQLKEEISKKKKIALICAGGGITGGIYEIGCLRAIDDFLVNKRVTDFDIFIGISAGSIVASALSFGVSPESLFNTLIGNPKNFLPFKRSYYFKLNTNEFIIKFLLTPIKIYQTLYTYIRNKGDLTLFDALLTLKELLPSGIFNMSGLEKYIRRNFTIAGRKDSFRAIDRDKELYIISVDLDTGERVVFGEPGTKDVPISKAVTASAALPLLFKPVRIKGRDHVDGAVLKTLHIDVAIEHGADLVICINPIVPVFNDPNRTESHFLGAIKGPAHLSERGYLTVLDQIFRIAVYARLQIGLELYLGDHPDIDIILIEPDRNDYMMFFYNIMRYSSRILIAEHGFKKTKEKLEENLSQYREIFLKHGIRISRKFVDEEYEEMEREQFTLGSIAKVLGSITGMRKSSIR